MAHEHGDHHHDHVHDAASAMVEGALVIAKTGARKYDPPVTGEVLLARVGEGLVEIARLVAVDGRVAGQIKGMLDCAAGKATVSITRLDAIDVVPHKGWNGACAVGACKLTVNILSVVNVDASIEDAVDRLLLG